MTSWPKFSSIRIEDLGDRVVVSLNRPAQKNAIDQTMARELTAVCEALEAQPRILILTGCESNGKGIFASGADISQLRERRTADALQGINSTIFHRIASLSMPVIAAVDGWALGGGAELAYAADFRIVTERVKFGQPEVGLGIVAAAGGLWRLRELVGEQVAKELLFTGKIIDAHEAEKLGIALRVVSPTDLMAAAHELADEIAKQDPLAVQLTKTAFNLPTQAHPVVSNLVQAIAFESSEKERRMTAFLNRKKGQDHE